ncbi:hypothetical protein EV126DRAFT_30304 [Verticillium dahliae]|nr:hypothetical protein EV126DRAFT_30304 [Verticillium dahliae]
MGMMQGTEVDGCMAINGTQTPSCQTHTRMPTMYYVVPVAPHKPRQVQPPKASKRPPKASKGRPFVGDRRDFALRSLVLGQANKETPWELDLKSLTVPNFLCRILRVCPSIHKSSHAMLQGHPSASFTHPWPHGKRNLEVNLMSSDFGAQTVIAAHAPGYTRKRGPDDDRHPNYPRDAGKATSRCRQGAAQGRHPVPPVAYLESSRGGPCCCSMLPAVTAQIGLMM